MAIIARIAGEGIGPFRSFDFDFSDAEGKPHPGPHVFAGINGSGKSSVLKTIAWLFERNILLGFQWQEWEHLVQGYPLSRAMMILDLPDRPPFVVAETMDTTDGWSKRLYEWVLSLLAHGKVESLKGDPTLQYEALWPRSDSTSAALRDRRPRGTIRIGGIEEGGWQDSVVIAAYGPSRLLKHLPQVDLWARLKSFKENALSFEATVQNEAVQSWLLGLFSKRAIASQRKERSSKYSTALGRFEDALRLMCNQDVAFDVDIEPALQPKLLMYGKRLDFSQLPDGVRSTVGWLADFLMRLDTNAWEPASDRSSVLLLDEVDAHLHPKWQRSILPSIGKALPEVQVFVTSHSPFVIASSPSAKIHLLDLDDEGCAYNRPPVDAPVGESILATMKGIFGVSSRFDVGTEVLLEEWNQLRRGQTAGNLSATEKSRLAELTNELASRSEELRQIVLPRLELSESLISSLLTEEESVSHDTKAGDGK